MIMFLVLTGCALLAAGGAMYFAHAARHDPRWIAGSLFFPPVVPLYYRRHWEDLRVAALVQAAGLVMVVGGLLIALFQSITPDGVVQAESGAAFSSVLAGQQSGFVDSERALKLVGAADSQRQLIGRVHGSQYRPDRAELVDGVLRLSRGQEFFPDLEIAIDLGEDADGFTDRFRRSVGPDSSNAPPVYLSWRDERGQPVTEIIKSGYRMEVEMLPARKNEVSGYLRIILPDRHESYAVGEFRAVTNHLRYRGAEVDRRYDHEDTLFFVAEEFLGTQYPDADIDFIDFEGVSMDSLEGVARMQASVNLADGRIGRHVVLFSRGAFGWAVLVPESMAATTAAGFEPVFRVLPQEEAVAARPAARQPASRPQATERVMAFAELATLAGRGAVVEYRSGRREEGVLRGLRRERLVLESIKSGGVVEVSLAESEIALIRLTSGEVVRLQGAAPSSAPAAAPAAAPAPVPAAPAEPQVVAGVDVVPMLNRNVRVVAADGKTTVGVLRGINNRQRVVVETQVGGGKVDYTVPVDQVVSIEPAGR